MSDEIETTTMKNKSKTAGIIVYQAKTGAIELRGDFERDTMWATQAQISVVFEAERSVITKHIRNILKDKELDMHSVCAKIAHTAADGKTYQVQAYNLDVILAVGYRINSKRAIEFRKWATKILRAHIVDGYTINRRRIAKNYGQFMRAVEHVRALLPVGMKTDTGSILELISAFAGTWLSLDAYDRDALPRKGITKKTVELTAERLGVALADFKASLMEKGEATDLFGMERHAGSVSGIVGNVMQSFGGQPVYATIEEKAAHLLYFTVKNHPFTDGNKRSGAFAFVWFLRRAGLLNTSRMSPETLTALTLLVAESNPKDKERMIGLILLLLTKK